eukprot:240142-Rhodomonas_salina.1
MVVPHSTRNGSTIQYQKRQYHTVPGHRSEPTIPAQHSPFVPDGAVPYHMSVPAMPYRQPPHSMSLGHMRAGSPGRKNGLAEA